jgi:hypothetical protein
MQDSDHPGLIGSGTSIRASTAAASTALVVGAMKPARMLLVPASTAIVSSVLRTAPSAYRHMMSRLLVSMGTTSPGRSAVTGQGGIDCGLAAGSADAIGYGKNVCCFAAMTTRAAA